MEPNKTLLYKFLIFGFLVFVVTEPTLAASKETKKNSASLHSLAIVTAPQFSGALFWAHKQGLKGKGETAMVLEPGYPSIKAALGSSLEESIDSTLSSPDTPRNTTPESKSHAIGVTSVFSQISPQSSIVKISLSDLSSQKRRTYPSVLQEAIQKTSVINYSAGENDQWFQSVRYTPLSDEKSSHAEDVKKRYASRIENFLYLASQEGQPKLLIVAAGNDGADLSKPATRLGKDWIYWDSKAYIQNEKLKDIIILAGALNKRFTPSRFSNFPGEDEAIQENFLCTLGEDILKMDIDHPSVGHGTSFAAPIIAGAVLLLKQKFPSLTIYQIKETLLESASKDFFAQDEYGETSLIYDPADPKPFIPRSKDPIFPLRFDPEVYGKGILDLRAAFVYGDLLLTSLVSAQGRASPRELRKNMKRILKEQEETAALKIQKKFREYKLKKQKKKPKKTIKAFVMKLIKKKSKSTSEA